VERFTIPQRRSSYVDGWVERSDFSQCSWDMDFKHEQYEGDDEGEVTDAETRGAHSDTNPSRHAYDPRQTNSDLQPSQRGRTMDKGSHIQIPSQ